MGNEERNRDIFYRSTQPTTPTVLEIAESEKILIAVIKLCSRNVKNPPDDIASFEIQEILMQLPRSDVTVRNKYVLHRFTIFHERHTSKWRGKVK